MLLSPLLFPTLMGNITFYLPHSHFLTNVVVGVVQGCRHLEKKCFLFGCKSLPTECYWWWNHISDHPRSIHASSTFGRQCRRSQRRSKSSFESDMPSQKCAIQHLILDHGQGGRQGREGCPWKQGCPSVYAREVMHEMFMRVNTQLSEQSEKNKVEVVTVFVTIYFLLFIHHL